MPRVSAAGIVKRFLHGGPVGISQTGLEYLMLEERHVLRSVTPAQGTLSPPNIDIQAQRFGSLVLITQLFGTISQTRTAALGHQKILRKWVSPEGLASLGLYLTVLRSYEVADLEWGAAQHLLRAEHRLLDRAPNTTVLYRLPPIEPRDREENFGDEP